MDPSLERTIGELLVRLTSLTERSQEAFTKIEADVQSIKDQRYRPYFASMGAFLVVVIGVVGYVYNLETRLTSILFTLNSEVAVTQERLDVQDSRLQMRTENNRALWETHTNRHDSLDEGLRIMVQKMIEDRDVDDGS